jgi:hypothetical protein
MAVSPRHPALFPETMARELLLWLLGRAHQLKRVSQRQGVKYAVTYESKKAMNQPITRCRHTAA